MRIISGSHKGRHIITPANLPVHPTTDMAKTGLFNILNSYFNIEELEVLDLFAGTGNISFEFASRGCRAVTSVDENIKCTSFIQMFAEKLNFERLRVVKYDVFNYLVKTEDKYDIIFADPPYDNENTEVIPEILFTKRKSEILKENGWLIIEHSKRNNFEKHPNFYQHRNYGKVNFSIFI